MPTHNLSLSLLLFFSLWQTPRVWLFGYDNERKPLKVQDLFRDCGVNRLLYLLVIVLPLSTLNAHGLALLRILEPQESEWRQDFSSEHVDKTVTYEAHPHLGYSCPSIHPCK